MTSRMLSRTLVIYFVITLSLFWLGQYSAAVEYNEVIEEKYGAGYVRSLEFMAELMSRYPEHFGPPVWSFGVWEQ